MQVPRGRFIALEGIDGCGKSTQAKRLAEKLGALLTREPGDTGLGTAVRGLVLDHAGKVDPRAEALLMIADRAQHVAEVVEPTLVSGRWVVSDRYGASTVAYQGYGRGLDPEMLTRVSTWAAGGVQPDLYVLIDVPIGVAVRRRSNRRNGDDREAAGDRMESEPVSFQESVSQGFAAQASADPDRWEVVDGTGHADAVADRVFAAVVSRLGIP